MLPLKFFPICISFVVIAQCCMIAADLPSYESLADQRIVLNTWGFQKATQAGWNVLEKGGSSLDAVEIGCSQCEIDQCDGTVGYGGSPDESGETTLDAMIMDGLTHDVGAVADLRRVKQAISVARAVLTYTKHTLIVGESATRFAVEMGFTETNLSTPKSVEIQENWKKNNCQPNFRQNVSPDPSKACGPYKPNTLSDVKDAYPRLNAYTSEYNHDTIGMLAIDSEGHIAAGTSTNGANHKIPGRVGDSPIAGAGAYVEQGVGGAAATGDGGVMMRFLPSYLTVNLMSMGSSPSNAAAVAISKIVKLYPEFNGAIVALSMDGAVGAACHGFDKFPYSYRRAKDTNVQMVTINCTHTKY